MEQSRWCERVKIFFKADIIRECREQVARENIMMMCLLNIVTMIFSLVMSFYTALVRRSIYAFKGIYLWYIFFSAVAFLFTRLVVSKRPRLIPVMIVVNYITWVTYFIIENVLFRPRTYITAYYVLMGLGVCFLMKPVYMIALHLLTGVILGVCIYSYEPAVYAETDMLNAMIMLSIGLVLGLTVLRFRMNAFRRNVEREREREIAELYQSIMDETQTGIYVRACGTYELLYLNRKAKEIFEVEGDVWEGEKCYKLFYHQDAPCDACPARCRDAAGVPTREVFLRGHYYVLKGQVINWCGSEASVEHLFDITDAKKASEQMRIAHENLKKKYEEELVYSEKAVSEDIISSSRVNLTQGIVEEMCVERIDGYERKYRHQLSYRERMQEFVKECWFTEEQNSRLSAESLLAQFESGKTSVSEEFAATLRSGKHVWLRAEVKLLRRPETADVMAFTYNRDITRERLLRYSIERIMSFEYDEIYAVALANESYVSVAVGQYVMREQQAEGAYNEELKHLTERAVTEEDRKKILHELGLEELCRVLETEQTHMLEVTLISSNGKPRRKQIRCMYLNEEARILLVVITDIEDVVKKEKEKQQQLAEALAMAREANLAKSNFLASMSHEIRTPMNAIIGLNAIIKEEIGNREQVLDCTEKLASASKYLLALLNDILDTSRIESGNMTLVHQPFDMDKFWDNVNILAKAQADIASVRYLFAREGIGADMYIGDATRLEQIMINLINNAIKFTSEKGYVRVSVTEKRKENGRVGIRVTVEDNGIGISKEFLPQVFGTFTQEHEGNTTAYKGSGLGLSIARSFARMMDGDITVHSEVGVGTTFTVCVELDTTGESICVGEQEEAEENTDVVRDFFGCKVLLAEDHPLNVIVAKGLLTKRGFEVTTVENGEEAVRCFAESEPGSFDAILMDIRMPVLDGIEATMQIRGMDRADAETIPIIAMTANAYEEDRRETARAGMNAHLAKPIDPRQLLKTLDEFIPAKVV